MGIIDDYYGGYESLALFTDEDGCVDFEAAYDAQLPDYDDGDDFNPGMDTFDRAFAYKMKQVLRKSPVLPGWRDTGRTTMAGKPVWEGSCSSCSTHTTVPFMPLEGGSPPQCRQCHAQSKAGSADKQGRGLQWV
ncbi:hypothetical protein COO60DRAFT_1697584 [Scenedesmus sp. NREL 46B-D3]|nr:hypothetical protein COO60DRAFT_1697584 [Scenedesmus sp. NREL 46B-D3]